MKLNSNSVFLGYSQFLVPPVTSNAATYQDPKTIDLSALRNLYRELRDINIEITDPLAAIVMAAREGHDFESGSLESEVISSLID
jgi:hypothetical protein